MALLRAAVLAFTLALATAVTGPAFSQKDDLQEASQLFKQGQFDRALDLVNGYLSTRPKDARGRFLKGLILAEQNKPAEAIAVFTALTQDYPELPEPYNNLAVLYASEGQYEKARAALEMAIRTHPSYATAHENLGDIYAKMASQAYDKALQLDRGNAAAQTKLNLIKELFSSTPSTRPASAKAGPATKVAVAPPQQKTPVVAPPPAAPTAKATGAAPRPPAPAPVAKAPAAPPPQPAAKPQAEPAAANPETAVLAAVKDWAKLWSENDVEGYLAHYAPDFDTPDGLSRKDWEAQRKARIAKPRKIQVELTALKVMFDERDRARVTFRQRYRSDTFKADNTKTLIMVKSGDKWLIQQERVGG